jgi:hypothetical protein
VDDRVALAGIVFVLETGITWRPPQLPVNHPLTDLVRPPGRLVHRIPERLPPISRGQVRA